MIKWWYHCYCADACYILRVSHTASGRLGRIDPVVSV